MSILINNVDMNILAVFMFRILIARNIGYIYIWNWDKNKTNLEIKRLWNLKMWIHLANTVYINQKRLLYKHMTFCILTEHSESEFDVNVKNNFCLLLKYIKQLVFFMLDSPIRDMIYTSESEDILHTRSAPERGVNNGLWQNKL